MAIILGSSRGNVQYPMPMAASVLQTETADRTTSALEAKVHKGEV